MASKVPGGVQSVYKKYNLGSKGIWDVFRRMLAIDPNRSTGVPLNAFNRNPSPGEIDPYRYKDVVTIPAGDIADNPYWKRDVRRAYQRPSVVTQTDVIGLLTVGSKAAPAIADGEKGTLQLTEVKNQEGKLGSVLASDQSKIQSVLANGGLPPAPGRGFEWGINREVGAGYPDTYPCRVFK